MFFESPSAANLFYPSQLLPLAYNYVNQKQNHEIFLLLLYPYMEILQPIQKHALYQNTYLHKDYKPLK